MKRIVAFDPGGSTGIATLTIEDDGTRTYTSQTLVEPTNVWDYLGYIENVSAVICEQFSSGGAVSKYGFKTVRVLGGIHALCHFRGIPLTWHAPAKRMPYLAEAIVIVVGNGGKKSTSEHEFTATAHLLAWLAHNEVKG